MGDDVMTIQKMSDKIALAGIDKKDNPTILKDLGEWSHGDFSSLSVFPMSGKFLLRTQGISPDLMQQTAKNALALVNNGFYKGNAQLALSHLKEIVNDPTPGNGFRNLDFNELVQSGVADRLFQLYNKEPNHDTFKQLAHHGYTDVQVLNMDLEHLAASSPTRSIDPAKQGDGHPANKPPPPLKARRESLRTGDINGTPPPRIAAAQPVVPAEAAIKIAGHPTRNNLPMAPA